jgi:hypothetical protein
MTAHQDDLLRAQALGRQHGQQAEAPSPIAVTSVRSPTPPATAAW